MRELIDLFWGKYRRLKTAIGEPDEAAVTGLDREVQTLIGAIFERQATNALEIQMQFLVAIELLQEEADDRCCVLRHVDNLRTIIERHVAPGSLVDLRMLVERSAAAAGGAVTDEAREALDIGWLETLPNRVSVISTDYRFVFSNDRNADAFQREPTELIGRHVGEFIGVHRYVQGFKERLDACFAGGIIDYTYADESGGRTMVTKSRLSPLYAPDSTLIGALVVMEEIADRRQGRAA